jgi:pyrroline-5-carboxylate reductase
VAGLRLAGDERAIIVYDRHAAKLRALRREAGIEIARNLESALLRAEMLIVAVRPASVAELLDAIEASGVRVPKLCVSLAAGIPLSKLRGRLGPDVRWVRAMPSPVSRVGRGLTALTFDRQVSQSDRRRVRNFFARVGSVLEIPEGQFDTFTATYSSSHGYHALATLAQAAQAAGLNRAAAMAAAAHALGDGILYWKDSGENLTDLLHEAATPGGIAAAAMTAMDKAGYVAVVRNGIRAGIKRARLNAKR